MAKLLTQKPTKMMKAKYSKLPKTTIEKAGPAPKDPFKQPEPKGAGGTGVTYLSETKKVGDIIKRGDKEYRIMEIDPTKRGWGRFKKLEAVDKRDEAKEPRKEAEVEPQKEAKPEEKPVEKPKSIMERIRGLADAIKGPAALSVDQIHPEIPKNLKNVNQAMKNIDLSKLPPDVQHDAILVRGEYNKQAKELLKDKGLDPVAMEYAEQELSNILAQSQKIQEKKFGVEEKIKKQQISQETDLGNLYESLAEAKTNREEKSQKQIEKRIDYIVKVQGEEDEAKLQDTYRKEVQQRIQQNIPKEKSISKNIVDTHPDLSESAVGGYMKHIINNDRRARGQAPISDIKEYYDEVQTNINNVMSYAGIKDYKIDPESAEVIIAGDKETIHSALAKIKDAIADDPDIIIKAGILGVEKGNPAGVIKFSKLGETKLYKPFKTSAVDVAVSIAKSSSNGEAVARRCSGIDDDGKPILQELRGEAGPLSRMIYAPMGTGKTEMIEGTIVSALEGNPDGTYKAIVVDPVGAEFKVLTVPDEKLTPADLAYKRKLQKWVDQGRLKIFSEDVKTSKRGKEFAKEFMDYLDKERATQSGRRDAQGLGNLGDSKNLESVLDTHMDEMNILYKEIGQDKALLGRFSRMMSGMGNSDARKNMMPLTCYAQFPDKNMNKALGIGWSVVGSIGPASAANIGRTHGIKWKDIQTTAANEIVYYDAAKGEYQKQNQMVVGPVIKREFGQLKEEQK